MQIPWVEERKVWPGLRWNFLEVDHEMEIPIQVFYLGCALKKEKFFFSFSNYLIVLTLLVMMSGDKIPTW